MEFYAQILTKPPIDEFSFAATPAAGQAAPVTKLCILVFTTMGGCAGWAVAAALDLGLGTCFAISSTGTLLGVWLGWKLGRHLES